MEMTEVIQYKSCFTDLTFRHVSKCLQAYDSGELLSSIIWGAVFVEALLKDILFELDKKEHDVELNQLIIDLNISFKTETMFCQAKTKICFGISTTDVMRFETKEIDLFMIPASKEVL